MAKSKQLAPKKIGNSDMIGARGVNVFLNYVRYHTDAEPELS